MAKSTSPLAPRVASVMGVSISPANAEKTAWNIDICQADFDELLAELTAEGASPLVPDRAAYDRLQNEGYGKQEKTDRTPWQKGD